MNRLKIITNVIAAGYLTVIGSVLYVSDMYMQNYKDMEYDLRKNYSSNDQLDNLIDEINEEYDYYKDL